MEIENNLSISLQAVGPVPDDKDNSVLRRSDFPDGFIFGAGTSAYQVEGGASQGGKGLSVWDEFCATYPDKIEDKSNGNLACGMYTKYKDDIRMMKRMGFDSYRFSIAWTRVLPRGRCTGGVNREGIDYYNDIINTVLQHEMIPFVTIFHWDLPKALQEEYGGFISEKIKDDFLDFAELCFWEFGDRVKHWTTINEPLTYAVQGYVTGAFPPGRKLRRPEGKILKKIPAHRTTPRFLRTKKEQDNPLTDVAEPWEAYLVSRNLLLAHAATVKLYKTKFQESQHGEIGIVLDVNLFVPYHENAQADLDACQRGVDFMLGWYLDPILNGTYPTTMIDNVPKESLDRAKLTPELIEMFDKYPIDFLGINFYTAQYGIDDSHTPIPSGGGYDVDQRVKVVYERGGVPIGPPSGSTWLYVTPWGIYWLLAYVFDRYGDKLKGDIYITENGYSSMNNPKEIPKAVCNDDEKRTKYHQDHLANILKVMKDKNVENRVKGYFVWAWCDNFEWAAGYSSRFGIVYIDYAMNDFTRYPKDSAAWFAKLLKGSKEKKKWPWWPFTKKPALIEGVNADQETDEAPRKRPRPIENGNE